MNIKISVIIPTLNRKNYLGRCVKSILRQSTKPTEIIVVDNSLGQNAREAVNNITRSSNVPVLYFSEPRPGTAFARNCGIRNSRYNLLVFIDDDCIASKNWVKEIAAWGKSTKDLIIMGKNLNASPDNLISSVEYYLAEFFFMRGFYFLGETCFARFLDTKNFSVKKSLLLKRGLFFDEKNKPFSTLEDVLFSMRLLKKRVSIVINPKMIVYHSGSHNLLDNFRHQFKIGLAYYHLLKKYPPDDRNHQFVRAYVELKAKELNKIDKKIKKRIFKKKGVIFKIIFNLLVRLDIHIVELGYKFQKIKELLLSPSN